MTTKKFASVLMFMALALVAKASFAADSNLRLTTATGICDKDSPAGTLCVKKVRTKLDASTNVTGTCVSDDTTLCLQNGRFKVTVSWATPDGTTGFGHAVPLNDGSGTFWFFSSDNSEMLVKVLDGCSVNNEWWIFYAATTNVEFNMSVGDMTDLWGNTFVNSMNHAAMPVQDTSAFACP